MFKPLIVSNSDRTTFKNCRRKWNWNSPNRQNLRPKSKQRPLWLGSLVHECLEDFYLGKSENTYKAFIKAFKTIDFVDREEYAPEIELAAIMLEHYSLLYPNLADEPFEVIAIEIPFQIPLPGGGILAGTIDGVIRWKSTGKIWILEHKTFSMHKDIALHDIDDQTSMYPAALNTMIAQGLVPGVDKSEFCQNVLYNGLWKKVPTEFKLLKSGAASKTLPMTTPQWAERSMKMLGKNTDRMVDKFSSLEHNIEKFFPRWEICRGKKEQKLAVNRFLKEYADMTELSKLPFDADEFYPNPTTECPWKCAFMKPCGLMSRGADYQYYIDEKFEQAPSRGEAYEKG